MSHTDVAQVTPQITTPGGVGSLYTFNSDPKALNGHSELHSDPKALHRHSDRQDQDLEAKKKDPKPRQRKHWKDKARRIIVGKEEDEELYEQKHSKKYNWLKKELRRHLAEFVGTFFLILFVCGIQVNQGLYPDGGVANIDKGLVSGFILVGLIFSFGRVSGAHFNPCVTLAFLLRGAFNFWRFLTYITAQFAGAVSGAAVLYGLFGIVDHLGATVPGAGLENSHAFGVEILITFILITVILSTAEDATIEDAIAGLAVGLTFGAIEIWAWNFTGASVNPWRSIAPIMISDFGWKTYWIYIIGPLVGTILAVLMERFMKTGVPSVENQGVDKVSGAKEGDDVSPFAIHHDH